MAWENRNGRQYYYRKRREGNRVVSEYVGSGELALIVSSLDELQREEWKAKRREARRRMQGYIDSDRDVNNALDVCASLVSLALVSAGYHMHKGQWRRHGTGKRAEG